MVMFQAVLFTCTLIGLTVSKWPNRNNDTLVFVANPIEANMPGHWIPLSIVKIILGGHTTAADLIYKVSKTERTTMEVSITETTHPSDSTPESTTTIEEDKKLTGAIDETTTEEPTEAPTTALEPPATTPEPPATTPEPPETTPEPPETTPEPPATTPEPPAPTPEPPETTPEPPPTTTQPTTTVKKTPRRGTPTDAHENVNN